MRKGKEKNHVPGMCMYMLYVHVYTEYVYVCVYTRITLKLPMYYTE